LPRLQGAQSAARDAARKSDLSQLWSAILQYYNNRGEYPEGTGWTNDQTKWKGWNMINVNKIWDVLVKTVELSSVPADPNRNNVIKWKAWTNNEISLSGWQYGYFMTKKNSIDNGGYVLVARTETEWGSNYLKTFSFTWDMTNIKTCVTFKKSDEGCTTGTAPSSTWFCCYTDKSEFLYLYMF
jgi:hypothetical protein